MLERLIELAVRRRGVVLVAWAGIAIVAAMTLPKLSIDAVPDVTNTQVQVMTTAPGLSPAEVEQYVTYPVESGMNGVPGVTEIRSVSRTALSVVTIVFADGTDIWFARQLVAERLKQVDTDIPANYGHPYMAPVSTSLGEIYQFYLTSDRHTPMELRTILDWQIAKKLRSVPGVIEVNAMGGEAKQYQVVVDPRKLAAYRVTLRHLSEVLERNNAALGAGYIERNREAYVIRADAQYKSADDIANTVVTTDSDGTPVLLRQIADVRVGPALRFGAVTKYGEGEIVSGTVMMLIGANSREVVANVKHKLAQIEKELPPGVQVRSYYDRAEFIGRTLETVAVNLAEGAGLVVVVLFLTLGSLRGSLIAALAIPMAMAIAILGMERLQVTGNLMSLGAIDFGLLVDGAIVMLEVALAQLAFKRPTTRKEVARVVAETMRGAARPVAFSLAIIMLVYLPLMALQGVEGRMFQPMAITVALALAGALAFTLTAFPALAAFVLTAPRKAHDADHGVFGRLARRYALLLERLMTQGKKVAVACLVVLGLAAVASKHLGAEFVPRLEEGELALNVYRPPSISLTEAERLDAQVERVLSSFPEVTSVVAKVGRPEVPTDPVGFEESDVRVKLKPKSQWTTAHDLDGFGDALKRAIEAQVPATEVSISQPIEDSVNDMLIGFKADVVIKLFGTDLHQLKAVADQISATLEKVDGTGDIRRRHVLGLPLLDIRPDRAKLSRYGVPAEDVLQVVQASRIGQPAGTLFEGNRRFDIMLLMPPASLTTEGFGDLLVGTPSGQLIPLASVADLVETEGPAAIYREALERRTDVGVNVRGMDLVSYVGLAQAAVAKLKLPPGIRIEWGGQFENFTRAKDRLLLVVPVALAVIFVMLFLMFGDTRAALAVFVGVPFALVGGVTALLIRGLPFSIPAAVGFIAVSGVAVLNGVVMPNAVRRRARDRGVSLDQALRDGAVTVLRPVLTTALVAAIGFLPMAMSTHPGAEVQRPLATVVIGGILSSTVLTLLVLPLLLRALGAASASRAAAEEEEAAPRLDG
jgi:cobalt-zinc-cadmium resistance protein CzcA